MSISLTNRMGSSGKDPRSNGGKRLGRSRLAQKRVPIKQADSCDDEGPVTRDPDRPPPDHGPGWLRLQRRHCESISIGDDIEVRVDMDGPKVHLLVRAPGKRILRTELLER